MKPHRLFFLPLTALCITACSSREPSKNSPEENTLLSSEKEAASSFTQHRPQIVLIPCEETEETD